MHSQIKYLHWFQLYPPIAYNTAIFILASCEITFADILIKPTLLNETSIHISDAEADFGPRISKQQPVAGRMYPAEPNIGCVDSIPLPENSTLYVLPFIALIKRGSCTFAEKVLAANKGGYQAAIVYNDVDDTFFTMGQNGSVIVPIPAVMIGLHDGLQLLEKFCFPKPYILEIHHDSNNNLLYYIIPMLLLLSLLVITLAGVYAVRCWRNRRERQLRCLSRSQLQKLPILTFEKGQCPYETCAICLDDFENGAQLRVLPCRHAYHSKCIDPWLLKRRRVCPICKRRIRRRGALPHDGREGSAATEFLPRTDDSDSDADSQLDDDAGTATQNRRHDNQSSGDPNRTTSYGTAPTERIPSGLGESNERTPLLSGAGDVVRPKTSISHLATPVNIGVANSALTLEDEEVTEAFVERGSHATEEVISVEACPPAVVVLREPVSSLPPTVTRVTALVHRSSDSDPESELTTV